MPYIYVSQVTFNAIKQRQDTIYGTAEHVIVAALEQTSSESMAQYYRRRFYVVAEADARCLADRGACTELRRDS